MTNNDIEVVLRKPSAEEYSRLREAAGWSVPPLAACEEALRNSVFGAVAVRGGRAVGMVHVVGDGALWNYIQDLIVQPECQRQGVGRRLMEAAMAELARRSAPKSNVALISAPKAVQFYERFGFERCPPDRPAMRRKL